ncbi:MAG: hypothetical protein K0U49_11515 [Alphaproteobacteria bacterium]|nr:hypothetical protein [Alphaproteobacteria bacterium]
MRQTLPFNEEDFSREKANIFFLGRQLNIYENKLINLKRQSPNLNTEIESFKNIVSHINRLVQEINLCANKFRNLPKEPKKVNQPPFQTKTSAKMKPLLFDNNGFDIAMEMIRESKKKIEGLKKTVAELKSNSN